MTVKPGTYNIILQRRATYSLGLQFKDDQKAPIDLTGATVISQVWDRARTKKYADFSVAYTNRINGQVALSLTPTQTEQLPVEAFYDVLVEDSSGDRSYYLEGKVEVSQGYSA